LIYIFLAAATLIAFWQLKHCDFANYDDDPYVTQNGHIRDGITAGGIRWAFTTSYHANWHPLTWISHMLDVQLFGLNPRWHTAQQNDAYSKHGTAPIKTGIIITM
jgi:protein O-mannosyl-transferase